MDESEPFIKKQQITNKKGQNVTYTKKEIRDTIIWHTYEIFIEKNELEDCYFISNNVKEFGAKEADETPMEEPYPLHNKIKNHTKMTALRNIHDFLSYKSKKVEYLFQSMQEANTRLLIGEVYEQMEKELRDGLGETLVRKYLLENVEAVALRYISNLGPEEIHEDYSFDGFVLPTDNLYAHNFDHRGLEVYGKDLIATVRFDIDIEVFTFAETKQNDNVDSEYRCVARDVLRLDQAIYFLIPLELTEKLNKYNFSFENYLKNKGIKPSYDDLLMPSHTNINHVNKPVEEIYIS